MSADTGVAHSLSALTLATGVVLGTDPDVGPLPAVPPGLSTRAALERAVLPALQRQPCLVSFSGGRDSSAILALAAHVARREGLPLPVPVTMRFPACLEAEEDEWQEMVIRHLELPDWVRLDFDDELDIVGPHAQAVLRCHGVLWPFNAHAHLPLARCATGGTLLTGRGGDELLFPDMLWRRLNQVLTRRARPRPRDVVRLVTAYGPAVLRRYAIRRRLPDLDANWPWLRAEVKRDLLAGWIADLADTPIRWDSALDLALWRSNVCQFGSRSLSLVGAMHDAIVVSPFVDPLALSAFAREGGRAGLPNRTAAMRHLVGDLLPEALVRRVTKATFRDAFWSRYAAAFAGSWDGSGIDRDIVDGEALLAHWTSGGPVDARTFGLLQTAWMVTGQPCRVP